MSRDPADSMPADSMPADPASGDENIAEANVRRALRRGNINFEFLDPREAAEAEALEREAREKRERRSGERKDKRGLFNRGRPPRPITRMSMLGWGLVCCASLAGLALTFVFAESIIWLLGMPVFVAAFFWSLMMLTLFAARPR